MIELLTPAKVNLSLRLKGQREDGFHEIETLMCPVSVFDRLEIAARESGGIALSCDDPSLPTGDDNLVVRAAKLFCGETGIEPHLQIQLRKGIPHGAGLGGGSSDAAATLLCLDALFQTALPRPALAALGAELGSDVPFFVHQSAAICRGRGEHVTPVAFPHRLPLLLIKPPFGVPTPWAYQRWQESRDVPSIPYAAQPFAWGELVNDLERPVFEKYLFLAQLKQWLLAQAEAAGALMSGSGSTIFALLHDAEAAESLGAKLAVEFGENLWCCFCETIATEPPP